MTIIAVYGCVVKHRIQSADVRLLMGLLPPIECSVVILVEGLRWSFFRQIALFSLAIQLVAPAHLALAQEYFGKFEGELIVKALPGGRNLELTHPFSFTDPNGKLWTAPVGMVTEGASMPQAFWSIIGGPFEDKYREASVIHDRYCDDKTEPWEKVHLVFYQGMRARGVGSIKAKIMYAAVYNFGPRWISPNPGEGTKLISGQPILMNDAKDAIFKYKRISSLFQGSYLKQGH